MEIIYRISAFTAGSIQYMNQYAGAFNMTQEFIPQTYPFTGPFNKTWNIRHNKASGFIQVNHAKNRIQCSEMISSYLRLSTGYFADKA